MNSLSVMLSLSLLTLDGPRAVVYHGPTAPSNCTPTVDNGYLVAYGPGTGVTVYGKDGLPAFHFAPEGRSMVTNVAVDSDGVAAVGAAYANGGTAHRIFVLNQDGTTRRVIETGDYLPANLSFAPDHSIWTSGSVFGPDNLPRAGYDILRHYSREGRELGRHWPRSLFPSSDPVDPSIGMWRLRVAGDRIGAFFIHGGRQGLWVEGDLEGRVTGRWALNVDALPAAFASDGSVYAQAQGGVLKLNHATGQWLPVALKGDGVLAGAQGDDLVFWQRGANSTWRVALR